MEVDKKMGGYYNRKWNNKINLKILVFVKADMAFVKKAEPK